MENLPLDVRQAAETVYGAPRREMHQGFVLSRQRADDTALRSWNRFPHGWV